MEVTLPPCSERLSTPCSRADVDAPFDATGLTHAPGNVDPNRTVWEEALLDRAEALLW